MITLTAPMVKKLDQLIAGGGGGGGTTDLTPVLDAIAAIPGGSGSTDLTPVLNAIAAIPAPTGGNVDLTPVLNAVAAVDSKAVALQSSVEAIPGGGGGSTDLTPVLDAIAALPAPGAAGSQIKSIQRLNISVSVPAQQSVAIPIATVNPAKTSVNVLSSLTFTSANINLAVNASDVTIVNTATSTSFSPILKMEIIEYV